MSNSFAFALAAVFLSMPTFSHSFSLCSMSSSFFSYSLIPRRAISRKALLYELISFEAFLAAFATGSIFGGKLCKDSPTSFVAALVSLAAARVFSLISLNRSFAACAALSCVSSTDLYASIMPLEILVAKFTRPNVVSPSQSQAMLLYASCAFLMTALILFSMMRVSTSKPLKIAVGIARSTFAAVAPI